MYTQEDKELRNAYCWHEYFEYLADVEMAQALRGTKEEQEEHIANAIVAEYTATYIHDHYRGIS